MWCDVCEESTEFVMDDNGNQYCMGRHHSERLRQKFAQLQQDDEGLLRWKREKNHAVREEQARKHGGRK